MKKICFLLILIVLIIIVILIFFMQKQKNTVDNALSLIEPKITNNMYLKEEIYLENNTESNLISEIYCKDSEIYKRVSNVNSIIQEYLFNFETKKQINIIHDSKEITSYNIDELSINPIVEALNFYKNMVEVSKDTYEYLEEKDGYLKFSVMPQNYFLGMTDETKVYFYIDEEQQSISRVEYYNLNEDSLELYSTTLLTYSYNTVTDSDILKFDSNNYQEYKYTEYIEKNN